MIPHTLLKALPAPGLLRHLGFPRDTDGAHVAELLAEVTANAKRVSSVSLGADPVQRVANLPPIGRRYELGQLVFGISCFLFGVFFGITRTGKNGPKKG